MFIIFMVIVTGGLVATAAYFSIIGIASIFAYNYVPALILGTTLEAGKISVAVYLYRYWQLLPGIFKSILLMFLTVLMIITSVGIFGFLSQGYQKTSEEHRVMLLELKLPATERMQFLAGQYVDFLLPDGRRRSFSIANPPHDDEFIELHVRHVEGGYFTGYIFQKMEVGETLRIEGPFGPFSLREESERPMILMAGGTGFAPIKGIIEHALAEQVKRPMHLYWGVRSKRDLYLDELADRKSVV